MVASEMVDGLDEGSDVSNTAAADWQGQAG
jgi:hypothetical protein